MKLCMRRCAVMLAAGMLLLGAEARAAGDEPWTLDANNWQEGKDLLPDPVVKHLQKGEYWFKVVPVDPAKFHHNYSKAFWDETESNVGMSALVEKTCGMNEKGTDKIPDFVFGQPFPKID